MDREGIGKRDSVGIVDSGELKFWDFSVIFVSIEIRIFDCCTIILQAVIRELNHIWNISITEIKLPFDHCKVRTM